MHRITLVLFVLFSLCRMGLAQTVPAMSFNVNWPPDAFGSYSVVGAESAASRTTASGTFTAEEGKSVRIVGTGFDASFSVLEGKIHFQHNEPPKKTSGIRIDAKTNTVSFVTVKIGIAVKNVSFPVTMDSLPITATATPANSVDAGSGTTDLKVVYGKHSLACAGAKVNFNVDEKGFISLDNPGKSISVNDSIISIEGLPFQVATAASGWKIGPSRAAGATGNGAVYLLAGDYMFQATKMSIPFSVNNDGLLSLSKTGPFTEVIALADTTGAPVAKIMIPDGETKMAARLQQEKTDQTQHDKILAASATAAWKKDFTLVEKMNIYDFPEEQLSYPVELPAGTKPDSLKLLAFTDTDVRVTPFQLSGAGTIYFRSDLPRGATRLFRLVSGFDTKGIPEAAPVAPTVQAGASAQEAILGNGLLLVNVPTGHQNFPGGKPLSQVPGPILGVARKAQPQPWMATSSFSAPDTLKVDSMNAKTLESGPLFTIYQVSYKIEGGKSYTVMLELRANEPEVRIAESVEGFNTDDLAFLQLNYGKGNLDPDRRLVASNGGYDVAAAYSGAYDMTDPAGKLNYCLGLFTPNALGVMHATAFYQLHGTDAMLISLNRLTEWQTAERALWGSGAAFENLRFYSKGGQKYLTAGLAGPKRFWVLGLIPAEGMKLTILPGTRGLAAGPEVRLFNQLTDWSLNGYKDRSVDWPETLGTTPFDQPDFEPGNPMVKMTYDDYVDKFMTKSSFFQWVVNDDWDYSGEAGAVSFRSMPSWFGTYAISRASWTQEQRNQIRDILLFFADSCEGDANQPHHSMMSGHPNFVADVKAAVPIACATFPNYPRAKMWRDSFMDYYNEWLDRYDRKDVPELNTKGGRWTENISCYVGQCFTALQLSQECLKAFDGTSLGKNPQLLALIRWMRDSFMSPHDGVRMIPPEGAHSFVMNRDRGFITSFFNLCGELAGDDPQLAAEMKWIETNGKEGSKPDIRSELFTDYGPVFHYDFGGPHESYAHMQNINGISYRWGGAGVVYYGAKGKVWSYNNGETNGDEFDINSISAFNVQKKGLGAGPTDQLLYDFDFAQFYRQPQFVKPGGLPAPYLARGVMLLRDDYLVLSDEVKDDTVAGTFNWVSVYDLPQIYQLKPGAPVVNAIARDAQPPRVGNPDRIGNVRSYSGKGDFLTVVAPSELKAVATPFGATVNGEYVFASQQPQDITEGTAVFKGTYGYARPNQLALFMGDKIGLNGFTLSRDGGDFGASAAAESNKITGRIVGRSGGKISIVPPTGFDAAKASVMLGGQPIPHTVEHGAIVFSVDIAQKDGLKNYAITF